MYYLNFHQLLFDTLEKKRKQDSMIMILIMEILEVYRYTQEPI